MNPIIPYFALPIAAYQLPKLEQLNKELKELILSSENSKKANLSPSQKIQPEVFESNFDFLDWNFKCCMELKKIALIGVKKAILETTNLNNHDFDSLKVNLDSWFHITRRGGYVQPHSHPNASWSFVYCVTEGNRDEAHADSGALTFHSPLVASSTFLDPTNSLFKEPYSPNSKKFILQHSQLIVFPSHMTHSVTPFFGERERITVAANLNFSVK